jgi:hypothetical protein
VTRSTTRPRPTGAGERRWRAARGWRRAAGWWKALGLDSKTARATLLEDVEQPGRRRPQSCPPLEQLNAREPHPTLRSRCECALHHAACTGRRLTQDRAAWIPDPKNE